jgi:hypothetical protein
LLVAGASTLYVLLLARAMGMAPELDPPAPFHGRYQGTIYRPG